MIICFQYSDTTVLVNAKDIETARENLIKISGNEFWSVAKVMATLKKEQSCSFHTS